MRKLWPSTTVYQLIYIGDAYDRCIVKPVRDVNGINHTKYDRVTCHQAFMWPDGAEHWVPVHTVVIDTLAVREEKGLDHGPLSARNNLV